MRIAGMEGLLKTYFASPERASRQEVQAEIEIVSNNPVISSLLSSVSGLLAILNEHRQIVSLNTAFLEMLGIDDPGKILGLRPGEAIDCVHAHDTPGGCGTTRYCTTCGAAIAIVASLEQDSPVERRCALTVRRGGEEVDMALQVRAHAITFNGRKFVLLFLQDITLNEQRASLERAFFHDINNTLSMLVQASELLVDDYPSDLSNAIYNASVRLASEVAIQRSLSESEDSRYQPLWCDCDAGRILQDLRACMANHQAARGKFIQFPDAYPKVAITTDITLLFRILVNMIINALEATDDGGMIRLWVYHEADSLVFYVWNDKAIPPEISIRIFQRNFSTKDEPGRGIGTFSMKLLGEKILGGQVSFTSSADKGTIFRFAHPISRS